MSRKPSGRPSAAPVPLPAEDMTDRARVAALSDEDIRRAAAADLDTWIPTEAELAQAVAVRPTKPKAAE